MKEERLYIVGYMACGKTTFGRALALKTGWHFLDLDEEIQRREGRSPAQIIAEEGEQRFRQIESMVLKSTSALTRTVIACGGGTPCYRDNMEFMTLHGMTLWLVASPRKMAARILEAGLDSRPLASVADKSGLEDFVCGHLRSRQPYYFKAAWRFSGENLENESQVEVAVVKFLNEFEMTK